MAQPTSKRPARSKTAPCLDWESINAIKIDRIDIKNKGEEAQKRLRQAMDALKIAIAPPDETGAKQWQPHHQRVRDFLAKTPAPLAILSDDEKAKRERNREETRRLIDQVKRECHERALAKQDKTHTANSPLHGREAKRRRMDEPTSSNTHLTSHVNDPSLDGRISMDIEESLLFWPSSTANIDMTDKRVHEAIGLRARPLQEDTHQGASNHEVHPRPNAQVRRKEPSDNPPDSIEDRTHRHVGASKALVHPTPRSGSGWFPSQTLPLATASEQTWLDSPLPYLESNNGYATSLSTPLGPLGPQRTARWYGDSGRSQLLPVTPFTRRPAEGSVTQSYHGYTMPQSIDDSLLVAHLHRDSLVRATSAQPSSQTLHPEGLDSSLPGTPAVSLNMKAMQNSLLGGRRNTPTPAPSDATMAAVAPGPRRTQRFITPAAMPRPSGKTFVLENLQSVQKRRIAQVTVPVQTQDGVTTWRKPVELPVTLIQELERVFYSAMEEREKARVWSKYSESETNCVLTAVIGRGATSSNFTKPFRACTMCIKRGRICAKLIRLDNGDWALGFHPLPSSDRVVQNWKDIGFYVNPKS